MEKINKKGKKNYKQVPNQEWIQMEDLNQPRNHELSKKIALQEGNREYERPSYNEKLYPSLSITSQQKKSYQPKQNLPLANKQNMEVERPRKKKATPSLPMMEVKCDFCTVSQQVPGNTQVYICGSCQGMNQCYPLYGVASCDCCQSNVGFGFGTSQFIKCPKCSSILKVPLQPIKHYESVAGMRAQAHLLPSVVQPQTQQKYMKKKEQDVFWEEREIQTPGKMPIEHSQVVIEEVDPEDM